MYDMIIEFRLQSLPLLKEFPAAFSKENNQLRGTVSLTARPRCLDGNLLSFYVKTSFPSIT